MHPFVNEKNIKAWGVYLHPAIFYNANTCPLQEKNGKGRILLFIHAHPQYQPFHPQLFDESSGSFPLLKCNFKSSCPNSELNVLVTVNSS